MSARIPSSRYREPHGPHSARQPFRLPSPALRPEEIHTQMPLSSRSSAVRKLPLAAALSPTLQPLYTSPTLVSGPISPRRTIRDPRSAIRNLRIMNRPSPKARHLQDPTLRPRKGAGNPQSGVATADIDRSPGAESPPPGERCYQLALVTPGISPLEAISRNWIRLMPNRRM